MCIVIVHHADTSKLANSRETCFAQASQLPEQSQDGSEVSPRLAAAELLQSPERDTRTRGTGTGKKIKYK